MKAQTIYIESTSVWADDKALVTLKRNTEHETTALKVEQGALTTKLHFTDDELRQLRNAIDTVLPE